MSHTMLIPSTLLTRLNALTTRWQRFVALVRDPYRPERHYMRGPGPKWHAKHGMQATASVAT